MRKLCILLLVSALIQAQTPSEQLIDNTWYLSEMTIDGEVYHPPSNEELQVISMDIIGEDGPTYTFHSEICSSIGGLLNWVNDEAFSFFDYSCCGTDMCSNQENYDFELLYSQLYLEGVLGQSFNYTISTIDDNLILTVISPQGNQAIYSNQMLSLNEILQHQISIYPNPVKDKLIIDNPDLKITSVSVSDVSGKTIFSSQNFNSTKIEIDFIAFSKGVYFLTTELDGKILKTEKVLKK